MTPQRNTNKEGGGSGDDSDDGRKHQKDARAGTRRHAQAGRRTTISSFPGAMGTAEATTQTSEKHPNRAENRIV